MLQDLEVLSDPLDVLVVAPHPDDAELGMGGAIIKMLASGTRVGILDLTSGEPTPFGTLEKRKAETGEASRLLGISWRYNLGLENRSLEPTLDNRRLLAEVFRLCRPRWIFAPYWEDAHPDHLAATELVEAARFWSKLTKTDMRGEPFHPARIFNYYCVHLKMNPQPAFILDISEQLETKLAAISAYASQFIEGRPGAELFFEQLKAEAGYWGKSIGVRYGEPFTCREPIGLDAFTNLI